MTALVYFFWNIVFLYADVIWDLSFYVEAWDANINKVYDFQDG